MAKSRTPITNTAELREMLLASIQSVRSGRLEPNAAQSIAKLSTQVLQSARLDLDVAKHNRTLVNSETVTPLANVGRKVGRSKR